MVKTGRKSSYPGSFLRKMRHSRLLDKRDVCNLGSENRVEIPWLEKRRKRGWGSCKEILGYKAQINPTAEEAAAKKRNSNNQWPWNVCVWTFLKFPGRRMIWVEKWWMQNSKCWCHHPYPNWFSMSMDKSCNSHVPLLPHFCQVGVEILSLLKHRCEK